MNRARYTLVRCFSDQTKSSLSAGYKAMYAAALRGSQSKSRNVSEQVEQARLCLQTVNSLRNNWERCPSCERCAPDSTPIYTPASFKQQQQSVYNNGVCRDIHMWRRLLTGKHSIICTSVYLVCLFLLLEPLCLLLECLLLECLPLESLSFVLFLLLSSEESLHYNYYG